MTTPFFNSLGGTIRPETGALQGNVGQAARPGLSRFNYQGPNMANILAGLQGGSSPYTPIKPPAPAAPTPPAAGPGGGARPQTTPISKWLEWIPGMGGYFSPRKVPDGMGYADAYMQLQGNRGSGPGAR